MGLPWGLSHLGGLCLLYGMIIWYLHHGENPTRVHPHEGSPIPGCPGMGRSGPPGEGPARAAPLVIEQGTREDSDTVEERQEVVLVLLILGPY